MRKWTTALALICLLNATPLPAEPEDTAPKVEQTTAAAPAAGLTKSDCRFSLRSLFLGTAVVGLLAWAAKPYVTSEFQERSKVAAGETVLQKSVRTGDATPQELAAVTAKLRRQFYTDGMSVDLKLLFLLKNYSKADPALARKMDDLGIPTDPVKFREWADVLGRASLTISDELWNASAWKKRDALDEMLTEVLKTRSTEMGKETTLSQAYRQLALEGTDSMPFFQNVSTDLREYPSLTGPDPFNILGPMREKLLEAQGKGVRRLLESRPGGLEALRKKALALYGSDPNFTIEVDSLPLTSTKTPLGKILATKDGLQTLLGDPDGRSRPRAFPGQLGEAAMEERRTAVEDIIRGVLRDETGKTLRGDSSKLGGIVEKALGIPKAEVEAFSEDLQLP